MPPAGGFLRLLATRPGRLDQPPCDNAGDVAARDRILRSVKRGEQRPLHEIAGTALGGAYGFDLHDPFAHGARRHRLLGLAQSVIDQPQALPARPDRGQPDGRIEQALRRIQMRQIGPLMR